MGDAGRRLLRPLAAVAAGTACLLTGAVTGVLGTAAHLATTSVPIPTREVGAGVPVGLLLAIALVVATDAAAAAATLRPAALVMVGVGRGAVLLPLVVPDPGGNMLLTGALASTLWVLVAILVPLFLAAPLSAGAGRRARRPAETSA